MSQKSNSEDSTLPTNEPQAPRQKSIESVDEGNPAPANPGSTPNGHACGNTMAGEPD